MNEKIKQDMLTLINFKETNFDDKSPSSNSVMTWIVIALDCLMKNELEKDSK